MNGADGSLRTYSADLTETVIDRRPFDERVWNLLRQFLYLAVLALVSYASAEVTARVDDWLREDVPLLESPDPDYALRMTDEFGTRGKPYGRYKKWHLNEWGFRGPSISRTPTPGTCRVMVLGASEAFGLYEGENKEFAAQLAQHLQEHGNYEVVNAAVTGMTLASVVTQWETWCSQFKPQIVVVYASPLFYLSNTAPSIRRDASRIPRLNSQPWTSRYLDRLRDRIELPASIQTWLAQREIAARVRENPPDWLFSVPPEDRLNLLTSHLRELGCSIQAHNAIVVLSTHATSAKPPLSREELTEYERGRVHIPRATARIAATFHELANDRIRTLARQEKWAIVDADAELSGRTELFGDLVHFTDAGASVIARMIADTIRSQSETTNLSGG
jgi:hypothetical protein